jgi:hypothetical protein
MSKWQSMQVCDPCWLRRCELRNEVGRIPHRIVEVEQEECCDCSQLTKSGIYIRDSVDRVPFPPKVED